MASAELNLGARIAGRFTVEIQVSWGIQGTLLRARDDQTGQLVALRVWPTQPEAAAFGQLERKMEALRGLAHPGLAIPLGYGRLEQGPLFLATGWIEGESLRQRLSRQALTARESVQLIGHVAAALGAAHRLGVVHCELRPSCLLLAGGEIARVQVAGFGMQPTGLSIQTISRSGEILRAVQYMAPEQAGGEKETGPGADVFALGCILFECLTGRVLFQGRHAAEVIERVLYQEAPALESLRPGLPLALGQLLARMLAKAPHERPADGEALARELAGVELSAAQAALLPLGAAGGEAEVGGGGGLGGGEQHLVCIVRTAPVAMSSDEAIAELGRLAAAHGARLERLPDDSLQATVEGHGQTAMDQAGQAARLALALGQRLGELPIAVATRRGVVQESGAAGDVGSGAQAGAVWLDELTAALVERRFHVRRVQGTLVLEGERDEDRGMLLGRPSPYVGREQELRSLELLYATCAQEEVAKGVLVLGASGMGKSRLRREFLQRAERQGAEVLLGRGDLIRAGTAYGLIRQAVLRLCGLEEAAAPEVRRQRLAERVGRRVEAGQRRRVVAFLGELCGVPQPEEGSPGLGAARMDPQLMRVEVQAAWLDFLRAECEARRGAGAVVLVLEDVHWSDSATIGLVEGMLGALAEQPLMLLALGRPETKELFPRLWERDGLQEIRLGGLSRKASERLVREMLGARATEDGVRRIVEQAAGHALFLEELIRAEAEGEGARYLTATATAAAAAAGSPATPPATPPATVMAMLQARFQRIDPGARWALRAASVFGERFWAGGVRELLGGEQVAARVIEHGLEELRRGEIIVRERESRYAGEVQYSFRHALLREAAYGLLEEADRRRGHGLVARYLERKGAEEAAVLAEHYREAGEHERAAGWYARAAEQAFESGDSQSALKLARLGVGCGAEGEILGRLRAVEAWTLIWTSGDLAGSYAASSAAVQLLRPGSSEWYEAMGPVRHCASILTREEMARYVRTLAEVKPEPGAESASVESEMGMVMAGGLYGAPEMARVFLRRLEETCARLGEGDARAQGLLWTGTLWYRFAVENDVWGYWVAARKAVAAFEVAGHRRYWGLCRWHTGCGYVLLGDLAAARQAWAPVQAQFEQFGEFTIVRSLWALSALALQATGEPERCEEAFEQAERTLAGPPLPLSWRTLALVVLAEVLRERGDLAAAEARARQANEASIPAMSPLVCAVLGRVLLAEGQVEAARQKVEEGLAQLAALGGSSWMDIRLHVAAAEVYQALGDAAGARLALVEADRKIRARAEKIEDTVMRERFLLGLQDHVRVRELLAGGQRSGAGR